MRTMSATLELARRTPAATAPMGPVNLSGFTRAQLQDALTSSGAVAADKARMRGRQLWRWIHHYGLTDFAGMSDIDKGLKATLAERFTLQRPEVVERQVSADGTRKWLIRFAPGSRRRPSTFPTSAAQARCASPARSAAR